MQIVDLRQRHLAAFTRLLRESRPEGVESVWDLPAVESWLITINAANEAGWFADSPEAEDWPGDLTYQEAEDIAAEVWKAWQAVTNPDPNS